MDDTGDLSRISKLQVDRDEASPAEVLARRSRFSVTLVCGDDVEGSYTLQAAALTAAAIAARCFPGAVRIAMPTSLGRSRLLVWPRLGWSVEQAFTGVVGTDAVTENQNTAGATVLFGNASPREDSLRVTFDGWAATAGPAGAVQRLAEREYCPLAGILGGALAISELFLSFAGVNIEAARRPVGLSLWRPDLYISDPAGLGIPVEFLPKGLWALGLGHLGNAYLWTLSMLPYAEPVATEIALMDFDEVEKENAETGLLFSAADAGQYKTRICSDWLQARGFKTRLVERRFDATFRLQDKEPRLALCGFDSNPARRCLATADFTRVVESGLGGTMNNFDTISLHTLPHARSPAALWPDPTPEQQLKQRRHQEQIARTNKGYIEAHADDCGRYDLAGKAVAVPFVGTVAAALVVAEELRCWHEGIRLSDLKVRLGSLNTRSWSARGNYTANDVSGDNYAPARPLKAARID